MAKIPGPEAGQDTDVFPYLQMPIGEFCTVDIDTVDHDTWRDYLTMKVRMVRDRNESQEARDYFDAIQAAYEESFDVVTPDLLADATRLLLILCVDRYSEKQLTDLNFPEAAQHRLPGGLAWFDMTGTMADWLAPRIFEDTIAAGIHRNCGGLAITGALTGERQAAGRDRALTNAMRTAAELSSAVRHAYLRSKGSRVDPDARAALATFGGPKLVLPVGSEGSAENFITPKTAPVTSVDRHFTPRELNANVDAWVDRRFKNQSDAH